MKRKIIAAVFTGMLTAALFPAIAMQKSKIRRTIWASGMPIM